MSELLSAKTCELHVHIGGCLTAEDLFELGREVYDQIDWSLFVNSFESAYGTRPDPPALYRQALAEGGGQTLRPYCVYGREDGGDFARFQAKFNFSICLFRHWWHVLDRQDELLDRIVERHRNEGLRYVEYRAMAPFDAEDADDFIDFHTTMARAMVRGARADFHPRYLISLPRWQPLESYRVVRRLLEQQPDLADVLVGLDFCHFEEGYPPESTSAFFERLHRDNADRPAQRLDVAYHVGEVYFDKSLESAVRWCHEAAELGAARLGHCTALGLDPAAALARREQAHECEPTSERLAQIRYDLHHAEALIGRGIVVDCDALRAEQDDLSARDGSKPYRRSYSEARLEEIRLRQTFVLDCLTQSGTVIETCPTSNLRIGAVPTEAVHPVHNFLASDVSLAIGADDPGLFDCRLEEEVDWVLRHGGLDAKSLEQRLADPYGFRCGRERPV